MSFHSGNRRAKIVCTMGPSANSYKNILALANAGMDVARLNFSHGTHEEHEKIIAHIRKVSEDINKPIAIIQDLQGPKIRIGKFKNGKINLRSGDAFTLTTKDIEGNEKEVSVSYKSFNKDVKINDIVLLDDGLLRLKVKNIAGQDVHCQVEYGGMLSDKKGINLPGSLLSVEALTEKDKTDLLFGLEMNVDYVALSFVQKADDIRKIKNFITKQGKGTPVIAKIEKPQAVEAIEDIADIADAIMVARGDLGVEVNPEEVPPIQKHIISLCNQKGIPVITATQMLDSMIHNPRPTRAEASDVANAILDGTDAVMLSGETASGNFPIESVETMHRIVSLIEEKTETSFTLKHRKADIEYRPSLAIGYCACDAADLVRAKAIVCLTQTGSTARMISRYRPQKPIIAITHTENSLRRMGLIWGVSAFKVDEFQDNMDHAISDVEKVLMDNKIVNPGDKIILTAGLPFSVVRKTNMLRIEEIKETNVV